MADDPVQQLRAEALAALAQAADEAALDAWRIGVPRAEGGRLTGVLRGLGSLSIEERKTVGAARERAEARARSSVRGARAADLRRRDRSRSRSRPGSIDVTLPARPHRRGGLHPVTQLLRKILDAFASMGFSIVEGPEVELDYYNFEALRIPADHPARDMWDTMWVDEEVDGRRPMLLRTHTSPMQIRFMEQHKPPIRIAVPGRAYRFEATDTTHEWMMTQVEMLAVDEGLTWRT